MTTIYDILPHLGKHPEWVLVTEDNLRRRGEEGFARFWRKYPNVYKFTTKRDIGNVPESLFTLDEYRSIYKDEIFKLKRYMNDHPDKTYWIDQLGLRTEASHSTFIMIIEPQLKQDFRHYENVKFLW